METPSADLVQRGQQAGIHVVSLQDMEVSRDSLIFSLLFFIVGKILYYCLLSIFCFLPLLFLPPVFGYFGKTLHFKCLFSLISFVFFSVSLHSCLFLSCFYVFAFLFYHLLYLFCNQFHFLCSCFLLPHLLIFLSSLFHSLFHCNLHRFLCHCYSSIIHFLILLFLLCRLSGRPTITNHW